MKQYSLTQQDLSRLLHETLPGGGSFPLTVTGWSMRPLLRHGQDTVWLQAFQPEQCQRGSILLFRRADGRFVLHRVRRCLHSGYLMNGDAQSWCETITPEQILAQAYQICRGGRRISCSCLLLRIWDMLWFPTKPLRPLLFQVGHQIKRLFLRGSGDHFDQDTDL